MNLLSQTFFKSKEEINKYDNAKLGAIKTYNRKDRHLVGAGFTINNQEDSLNMQYSNFSGTFNKRPKKSHLKMLWIFQSFCGWIVDLSIILWIFD